MAVGKLDVLHMEEHEDGSATVHVEMDETMRDKVMQMGLLALLTMAIEREEADNGNSS